MMSCEQHLTSVSLLVDGMLDGQALAELEAHLAVCPDCAARRDAFTAMRDVMSGLVETPPDTLATGVLLKIKEEEKGRTRFMRRGWIPLCAAAAVLALVLLLDQGSLINGTAWQRSDATADTGADMASESSYDTLAEIENNLFSSPGSAASTGESDVEYADDEMLESTPADERTDLMFESTEDGSGDMSMTEWFAGSAQAAGGSAYATTVTLYAEEVPEMLADYPRDNRDGFAEIVLPMADLHALWPELRRAGAQDTEEINELFRKYQDMTDIQENGDSVIRDETDRHMDFALIVVYTP